jgi:diguanylate cyclase (GGDEF)-like protein/PAS domain S-box-containing protein
MVGGPDSRHTNDLEAELLREQRDWLLAVLGGLNVAWMLSSGGRILDVNQELCELSGFSREELIGRTMPWPFWPPEGLQTSPEVMSLLGGRAVDTDPVLPFEVPMMHRNGTRFIVEVAVAPARIPDGAVVGWVSTIHDVSVRHDYEEHLEQLATHDPLTGLPNRRLFEQRLAGEMADAQRRGRSLALALLDLDNFKLVNDRFGHPAGDRALRETARRLARVLRRGELLARLGGEEFAWILPETDGDGAWTAVERARNAIGSESFDGVGQLTISTGVALRDDLREPTRLYERADQALYQAKREGRDRTIVWIPQLSAVTRTDHFREFGSLNVDHG